MSPQAAAESQPNSTSRDPDRTRHDLLEAAEREIHLHGYQAASLAQIIVDAGVTKGALYHHFANKQALGYAVVDEIWGPAMHTMWVEPLGNTEMHPVDLMIGMIEAAASPLTEQELVLGCPINNLAQEMSPINEGFRNRINALLDDWRGAIAVALKRGQAEGTVKLRVQPEATAAMLVASLEGCVGMAKNAQSKDLLVQCGTGVIDYLNTLRA